MFINHFHLIAPWEVSMRVALEHVKRMRGGAQSHLLRCDDGNYYVTKFKNNPQHLRILANEMLASHLAALMGIPVPEAEVIDVRKPLIEYTNDLVMQLSKCRVPCSSGRQFGSRFPGNPSSTAIFDLMPDEGFPRVTNVEDFVGIYVFDKWTCNTDGRQAIFVPVTEHRPVGPSAIRYRAMMIDHGHCFDGGGWGFPDAPLRGLYCNRRVYGSVSGMDSFERWIDRLEKTLTSPVLLEEAERVPAEWIDDRMAWKQLIERLDCRRKRVPELIWSARRAVPDAFVNWKTGRSLDPFGVTGSPRNY
jgi:HipA-like protein